MFMVGVCTKDKSVVELVFVFTVRYCVRTVQYSYDSLKSEKVNGFFM